VDDCQAGGDGARQLVRERSTHRSEPEEAYTAQHHYCQSILTHLQDVFKAEDEYIIEDPLLHGELFKECSGLTERSPTALSLFSANHFLMSSIPASVMT